MKAEMPKLLKDDMIGVETVSNAVNVSLKVVLVGSIFVSPFFASLFYVVICMIN